MASPPSTLLELGALSIVTISCLFHFRTHEVIPEWYRLGMAMTLRLSEKQTAALKRTAEQAGISMQEAALQAVDEFINRRQMRLSNAISRVKNEDKELLRRLAQ